jgi:hypothetical protein
MTLGSLAGAAHAHRASSISRLTPSPFAARNAPRRGHAPEPTSDGVRVQAWRRDFG